MSGWKERLQKEHAELDERTNSLSDFFGKAESAELDTENLLLLRRQLRAMREYLWVLEQRMELNGMGPDCEEGCCVYQYDGKLGWLQLVRAEPMTCSIRGKYDIYSTPDRPAGEPKWRVGERPVHPGNPVFFKSDDLGECKRWIEEREYEGGYAKSRPRGPDGRVWTSPFQTVTSDRFVGDPPMPDVTKLFGDEGVPSQSVEVAEPSKKMGWTTRERKGWEVKVPPRDFDEEMKSLWNTLKSPHDAAHRYICSLDDLKELVDGQKVIVMGICGWEHGKVVLDKHFPNHHVDTGGSIFPLSRADDDRNCWVTSSQINKRAIGVLRLGGNDGKEG